MTKKMFSKWMKVFKKIDKKNKEMLKEKEITTDVYSLLTRINLNKYEMIIGQYHKELV